MKTPIMRRCPECKSTLFTINLKGEGEAELNTKGELELFPETNELKVDKIYCYCGKQFFIKDFKRLI